MVKRKDGKILITGGAGYIGSIINKLLNTQGYSTVVLDNLSRGHTEFLKWGEFVSGDLRNKKQLSSVFAKHRIGAVIHLAAYISVEESIKDPALYYCNNVQGTMNLLDVMLKHQVKTIVFSSSAAVYGIAKKVPVSLKHTLDPINPYGRTKLICEWMIKDYAKAYGLKYVVLRYFNAAGADVSGELGAWHNNETALIPLILDVVLKKNNDIKIFGNDYPTPDGTGIRDYIHVNDLAVAHQLALEYINSGGNSCTLNLGTGKGFSVKQVISTVEKVTRSKVTTIIEKRRMGDPAEVVADNSKAIRVLKWTPNYSSISYIIKTAYRWHKKLLQQNGTT